MGRPRKCWSEQVGDYPHTVVVFEREVGGPLWLRYWIPSKHGGKGKAKWVGLKHRDRELGVETAKKVAGSLLAGMRASARRTATLAEVLSAYERGVAQHQKGYGPREAKRRIAIWTRVLGGNRDVRTIDGATLDAFVRDRRAGAIVVPGYELGASPSNRTIAADLEFLRAALNYAVDKVTRPNGRKLLKENPMGRGDGAYKLPTNDESTIKRPLVSYDRFEQIMAKADDVDRQRLFGGFMMLVEGLGWRVSAICQLRACDVDMKAVPNTAPDGRIYRRPETDKTGNGRWIPMSKSVRAAVDRIRAVNPALGEWPLFPAPRARTEIEQGEIPKPWTRHYARALLERAEKAAKLDKVDGGDFHCYRRKWATERKHLPDADLARAGGWSEKDPRALKRSYQMADDITLLSVVNEPTKLRDPKTTEAETA